MKKILVLCMSHISYGETRMGLSLARQLVAAGFDVHLMGEVYSEGILRSSGMPYTLFSRMYGLPSDYILDDLINNKKPDLIILADYFIYSQMHRGGLNAGPWTILDYGIPVIPIDCWEWNETNMLVDVYFDEKKTMPIDAKIFEMPAYLRPIPFCHLPDKSCPKAFHYHLYEPNIESGQGDKKWLRESLGLRDCDKIIMMTQSTWQDDCDYDMLARKSENIFSLICYYIDKLPENVFMLIVGDVSETKILNNKRLLVRPRCDPSVFNRIVLSVDMLLSLNISSTALTYAVNNHIPAIALTNNCNYICLQDVERFAETNKGGEYVVKWLRNNIPFYKFRLFPWGLYELMEAVCKDNQYFKCFEQINVLNEQEIIRTMHETIFCKKHKSGLLACQETYRRQVALLDGTVESFYKMMDYVGVQ